MKKEFNMKRELDGKQFTCVELSFIRWIKLDFYLIGGYKYES